MLFASARLLVAQSPLLLYSDTLTNGFDDWSWASHNLTNGSPVHSGSKSISVNGVGSELGGNFVSPFSLQSLAWVRGFSFWAHGGSAGGQRLQVYAEDGITRRRLIRSQAAWRPIPGSKSIFRRPRWELLTGADFVRITIQMRGDGTSGTFYLDDIQFDAKAIPAQVNVSVSTTQYLSTDSRHFGVNLATWDGFYDSPQHTNTIAMLQEMGTTLARMPGGSLSDEYHWATGTSLNNAWQWAATFDEMVRVLTNTSIREAFVTVNYGTGTPQEAAGWVRYANITNHLGYKYWEIGNECYGTWETDSNTFPHDAYTYATRASNYIAQMRASDPTIKVGVVAAPGETEYDNGYRSHPAYNPRTGQTNYGWTAVLTTLKTMNVTPDFLVHHHYPQWTYPE